MVKGKQCVSKRRKCVGCMIGLSNFISCFQPSFVPEWKCVGSHITHLGNFTQRCFVVWCEFLTLGKYWVTHSLWSKHERDYNRIHASLATTVYSSCQLTDVHLGTLRVQCCINPEAINALTDFSASWTHESPKLGCVSQLKKDGPRNIFNVSIKWNQIDSNNYIFNNSLLIIDISLSFLIHLVFTFTYLAEAFVYVESTRHKQGQAELIVNAQLEVCTVLEQELQKTFLKVQRECDGWTWFGSSFYHRGTTNLSCRGWRDTKLRVPWVWWPLTLYHHSASSSLVSVLLFSFPVSNVSDLHNRDINVSVHRGSFQQCRHQLSEEGYSCSSNVQIWFCSVYWCDTEGHRNDLHKSKIIHYQKKNS